MATSNKKGVFIEAHKVPTKPFISTSEAMGQARSSNRTVPAAKPQRILTLTNN